MLDTDNDGSLLFFRFAQLFHPDISFQYRFSESLNHALGGQELMKPKLLDVNVVYEVPYVQRAIIEDNLTLIYTPFAKYKKVSLNR